MDFSRLRFGRGRRVFGHFLAQRLRQRLELFKLGLFQFDGELLGTEIGVGPDARQFFSGALIDLVKSQRSVWIAGLLSRGVGVAIGRFMKQPVLLVTLVAQRALERVLSLFQQRLAQLNAAGVRGAGKKLQLKVYGIRGLEHGAKLILGSIQILELTEFRAQVAGILRVAQKVFFELGWRKQAGKFLAGLLLKPREFSSAQRLAGFPLCFHAVLRTGQDFLNLQFDLGGQRSENWSIQIQARTRRSRQVDLVARFPIRAQQTREQPATFLFQLANPDGGDCECVCIRRSEPPLMLRPYDQWIGRALAGVERVDVGDDDVANGLLGTTDVAEVGDVRAIVAGFKFLPGEKLPADDHICFDLRRSERRALNRTAIQCRLLARGQKPPGRQDKVGDER